MFKDIIIKWIDLMCKKQYIGYFEEAYEYSGIGMEIDWYSNDKEHNLLKGRIFVVNQIDPITRDLKKIGYKVGQGSQSNRGQAVNHLNWVVWI